MNDFEPPPLHMWQILLLVFLLFCSLFFSSSETAFLSTNKLRIKYLKKKKNKSAINVYNILQNKQGFLTTTLIANTIVNNLITVLITTIAVSILSTGTAVSLAIAVATILVLVFGEVIPKAIALVYPNEISLLVSSIIVCLVKVFKPIVYVFSGLTKPFLFFLGIHPDDTSTNVTEQDLKTFFYESEQLGQLSAYERTIMQKILSYADIQAKHIMTPRPEIKAINIKASIEEILDISEKSHFSRFPVYEDDIDNIKGIFYLKDFLFSPFFRQHQDTNNFELAKYLRPPVFVFENTSSIQIQKHFSVASQNMLVVLDEYGGTAGVITNEDLTEVVFGDIEDEYDVGSSKNFIKVADGVIVLASMPIIEFNEVFSTDFSDTKYETIAGFILDQLGDVPLKGAQLNIGDYIINVIEASPTKLKKLKVSLVEENK